MDLEDRQKQLTRWIDGELEGDELSEFEAMVDEDPQLLEAKSEADQLRQLLSTHMPAREIPNAEFFNHQIQRRIAEPASVPAAGASPAVSAPLPGGGGILSWFRSPFTLASAAAVIALGIFALSQDPAGVRPADHTSVTSTYTPDRQIDAEHPIGARQPLGKMVVVAGVAGNIVQEHDRRAIAFGPGENGADVGVDIPQAALMAASPLFDGCCIGPNALIGTPLTQIGAAPAGRLDCIGSILGIADG